MDKSLPANVDAEQATLGSCLLNREAVLAIAAWLQPNDFSVEQHTWVYEAIVQCYEERIPPDIRTVSDVLRRQERLDAIGGLPFLAALIDHVPTSYHVEHYARIVQNTALLRKLIGAGSKISTLGYDERDDPRRALDQARAYLDTLDTGRTSASFVPLAEVLDTYYAHLHAVQNGTSTGGGVPTGFRLLDNLTGGFQRSDLILVAARPGVGKTSAVLSMAYNIAKQGYGTVGIFSLEMSQDQLAHRLLAMDTQLDTHRLRTGHLHADELPRVLAAMGELSRLPIYIEDAPGLSITEVRASARRLHAQMGVDLIIVDYLQLMQSSTKRENRVQEVAEISRGLKALARELNVPVIALSQLSRAVEGRQSHVPMLSDLRESGALEQDADIVMFIYREELYDPDTDKQGIAELHIAKHRNGPLGIVPMHFDPATTRFHDLSFWKPEHAETRVAMV